MDKVFVRPSFSTVSGFIKNKVSYSFLFFQYRLSYLIFFNFFKKLGVFINRFVVRQTPYAVFIYVEFYRSTFLNTLFIRSPFFLVFKKYIEFFCFRGVPVKIYFFDLVTLLESGQGDLGLVLGRSSYSFFYGSTDLFKISLVSMYHPSSIACGELVSFCIEKNFKFSLVFDYIDFIFRESFDSYLSRCKGFLFTFKGRLGGFDRSGFEKISVGQVVVSRNDREEQDVHYSSCLLPSGLNGVKVVFCYIKEGNVL